MAIRKKRIKRSKSEGKIAHKKTEIDGIVFHSKMEANYYEHLKEQKEIGEVKDFTLQPTFVLQPKFFIYEGEVITEDNEARYKEMDKLRKKYNKINPDNKIGITQAIKYISDFDVTYKDNSRKIIDTKGLKTADFKIKAKMFEYRYSNLTLECVIWSPKEKAWVDFDTYQKSKKAGKNKNNGDKEI